MTCDTGHSSPEVLHYLHGPLGNVVALTDAGGTVVERYVYDLYGKTYIYTPTGVLQTASEYGNPFMWTGQRYDAAVGLYHFYARTYSPTLGRWLQRDPLGYVDGVNLYEYAMSQPVLLEDVSGLSPLSWFCKKVAKGVLKDRIKAFIEKRIKDRLKKMLNRPEAKKLFDEADEIAGMLDSDSWLEFGIELIPGIGDIYGGVKLGKRAKALLDKLEHLSHKVDNYIDALRKKGETHPTRLAVFARWIPGTSKACERVLMRARTT